MLKKRLDFRPYEVIRITQSVRHSQFIITWGPGAILEGLNGPRMIPMPDIGLFNRKNNISPHDYEISNKIMSQNLLGGRRIFRLPSNSELQLNDDNYLYSTRPFPEWWLCMDHRILYRYHNMCPQCRVKRNENRGQKDAIRFVMACPRGHLDDVNWDELVHSGNSNTCTNQVRSGYYDWKGEGGSLGSINIECPVCKSHVNLGWAYSKEREWRCRGRFPERENLNEGPKYQACSSHAIIIQRQASNLRMPQVVSLFAVTPQYTRLHNLLSMPAINSVIEWESEHNRLESISQIEEILTMLKNRGNIPKNMVSEILSSPWTEIKQAIQDIRTYRESGTYADMISREFRELIKASINGVPPSITATPKSPLTFGVSRNMVKKYEGHDGNVFRVAPVTPLSTVIVQKGYWRVEAEKETGGVYEPREPVSVHFEHNGNEWYPGVELVGEGIFITFDSNEGYTIPNTGSASWSDWKTAHDNPAQNYDRRSRIFRDPSKKYELNPTFVWWHTLSHLLLRVLAIDSGYSSASIRERIYFDSDEKGTKGGMILYATQPGEGTMGGIVSLAVQFKKLLERAYEISTTCPNDPLCTEHKFSNGKVTGSACFGCLFASETSCEHQNMWLDRHLIEEMKL